MRASTFFRFVKFPCLFAEKVAYFLDISSVFYNEIREIFLNKYEIQMLLDRDKDAIISRMQLVQNHEGRMREGWN